MNYLKTIQEEECFVMQTFVIWEIFYKEIYKQKGPGSGYLEHLKAEI